MATSVTKNGGTIVVTSGATTIELASTVLPVGTIIQVLSANCAAKDECRIVDTAGAVVFRSFAPAENDWNDRQTLNRQVRGCVVAALGGTTTYLNIFLPTGRVR